jgi:hypothetical protein
MLRNIGPPRRNRLRNVSDDLRRAMAPRRGLRPPMVPVGTLPHVFNCYWVLVGLLNGTFSRRFRRVIAGMRASRVRAFDHLNTMDSQRALTPGLRQHLHSYETRLCEVDLVSYLFVAVMSAVALSTIVASTVFAPLVVLHFAHPNFAWYGWLEAIVLEIPILALVIPIETLLFNVVPTYLGTAVVLGIFEAALVALAYESVRQIAALGPVAFAVSSGAVAGALYVALVQCMCLALHGLRRWRSGRHTYEALAEVLLDALHGIEHRPEAWMDRRFKVATAGQLEDASLLVERELPHRMDAADAFTDKWFRQRTGEVAAAFRLRKQQVFLPTATCRAEVAEFLAAQLRCVLAGDLGSMDRSEVKEKPAHWIGSVVAFAGRLAFGAAPLLAFAVINHFVKLPAALVTPMVVAGVIWIVLSIATLDPRYKEKLDLFGSVSGAVRGGR